ncbi:MAG TPA: four helix bundle protein [Chthoniobacterales bacterium]|nr:four helix bundle protein [Chthoniobacterales bacterium]
MKINTRSYKDPVVWQKSIALAKLIYRLTGNFRSEEEFGLVAQMRRAAISIPSNIAEGQARHTTGEFIQFISHAEGSVAELDTQLVLSVELHYGETADAEAIAELVTEVRKMLNSLRRKLSERA